MNALSLMFSLNPLKWLGDKAKEGLADGFTSMMMGLWSASMWLLKTAFELVDNFTPNVADPDLAGIYSLALWLSLTLGVMIAFGQIGLAVIRQDGRGFASLAAGVVQYGLVTCCWIGVCAGIITACGGLTDALLNTLLGVPDFAGYAAGDGFVDTVSGTVQATALGVCGLFIVVPAAFGNIIIMLVRSAALLILTVTLPITAAGSMSEGTKSWMWKSMRWFLACAFIEPLLALVLGMGVQFAWAGMPDGDMPKTSVEQMMSQMDGSSTSENIAMTVVGSTIMLVACFTPLVLFRLLAFVDPGTASGASFRSTLNANGGVAGLLKGRHSTSESAQMQSGAASEAAPDGRSSAETGAEAENHRRFQGSRVVRAAQATGNLVGAGMEKAGSVAQSATSMGVDVLGSSGIGGQGFYDVGQTSHSGGRRTYRRLGRPVPVSGQDTAHDTDVEVVEVPSGGEGQ